MKLVRSAFEVSTWDSVFYIKDGGSSFLTITYDYANSGVECTCLSQIVCDHVQWLNEKYIQDKSREAPRELPPGWSDRYMGKMRAVFDSVVNPIRRPLEGADLNIPIKGGNFTSFLQSAMSEAAGDAMQRSTQDLMRSIIEAQEKGTQSYSDLATAANEAKEIVDRLVGNEPIVRINSGYEEVTDGKRVWTYVGMIRGRSGTVRVDALGPKFEEFSVREFSDRGKSIGGVIVQRAGIAWTCECPGGRDTRAKRPCIHLEFAEAALNEWTGGIGEFKKEPFEWKYMPIKVRGTTIDASVYEKPEVDITVDDRASGPLRSAAESIARTKDNKVDPPDDPPKLGSRYKAIEL